MPETHQLPMSFCVSRLKRFVRATTSRAGRRSPQKPFSAEGTFLICRTSQESATNALITLRNENKKAGSRSKKRLLQDFSTPTLQGHDHILAQRASAVSDHHSIYLRHRLNISRTHQKQKKLVHVPGFTSEARSSHSGKSPSRRTEIWQVCHIKKFLNPQSHLHDRFSRESAPVNRLQIRQQDKAGHKNRTKGLSDTDPGQRPLQK